MLPRQVSYEFVVKRVRFGDPGIDAYIIDNRRKLMARKYYRPENTHYTKVVPDQLPATKKTIQSL